MADKNTQTIEKSVLFLKDLPRGISKRMAVGLKREAVDRIVKEITFGRSPVAGKRFKKYKKSYRDAIEGAATFRTINGKVVRFNKPDENILKHNKRVSPVNLILTGKMLESLTARQNKIGQVQLFFKDKKATFHNRGTNKIAARRMLPLRGEKFKLRIRTFINKIFSRSIINSARELTR